MTRVYCLLMCWLLAAPIFSAEWISHSTTLVQVYMHPGEETLAASIGQMADEEIVRLQKPLNLPHVHSFPIYAYTNRRAFLHDAGPRALLLGVSYRPSGMIRIDITGSEGPVRSVLAHEITHSLLNQKLDANIGSLPSWVNEGIAGFLATSVAHLRLPALARQANRGSVLSLEQLERAFDSDADPTDAYRQSLSMLAWLEYTHPKSLTKILDAIAVGKSFPRALRDVTALTPDEWLSQWQSGISTFEIWLNIFASPVVFAPLALLVIFAAWLRTRRNTDEEAEEEDEEEKEERSTEPLYPHISIPVEHTAQLAREKLWADLRQDEQP